MTYYVVTDESRMSNIPFDPIMGLYGDAKRVHATRKDAQAVADTLFRTGDWGDDTPPIYEVRETAMPEEAVSGLLGDYPGDAEMLISEWDRGEYGDLTDAGTTEVIRTATSEECLESHMAGPTGIFALDDGRHVYVATT